jgi:pyrroline-5-carboxylate reductase
MATELPRSLVLVGAGKMGGAMLEGWLTMGVQAAGITVLDPLPSPELVAMCAKHEVALNPPLAKVKAPQVIVLAVKPQMLDAVAPELQLIAASDTMVLSVLAGKTLANISARLPNARAIARAMPNLPASVGRGITGVFAGPDVTMRQRSMIVSLLSAVGRVEWVDQEDLIDAVTGVSGSGPAYVFYLVECLARAAEAEGLPADVSMRLARATIEGAGELLARTDIPPSVLRQNVTSPGGTTAAGLQVLMANKGLDTLVRATVHAARKRAEELSG